MRTLRVTSGPAAGQSLEVEQELVIGREGADLTIPDPQISRRHAAIRPVEHGVEIEDLASLNGTFVNGERISEASTLTVGGVVRVGDSDIQVELELFAPTRARDVIAEPDVTKARDVIAEPDVTKARDVVPSADDRTRVGQAAPGPPPAQPAQTEPPPGAQEEQPAPEVAAAAAPEAPAEAPAAAPPGGPRGPAPPPRYGAAPATDRSRRPPRALLLGAGVLAAAAIVVILVLVLGGGGGTKKRTFTARLATGILSQQGTKLTAAGTATASPGGDGAAVVTLVTAGTLRAGKPVDVSGTVVFRFNGGRIDTRIKGKATLQPNRKTNVVGTGAITGGSGDFAGAKGSYSFTSLEASTVGHPTVKGTIEY